MAKIHLTSVVDRKAHLAKDVEIGPFCYIEADVQIGSQTHLDSHVTIKSGTSIGSNNFIGQGSVLGSDPQDRKYEAEFTTLLIGNNNIIREYVTIHRATGEGCATRIGNECYLMSFCHIGHNCHVSDNVTIANNSGISGYVTIEEYANIGGMTGVHQNVYIGKLAMVGAMSGIGKDVPPYGLVAGRTQKYYGINAIGLKRLGLSTEVRTNIKKASKILFQSDLGLIPAAEKVRQEFELIEEIRELLRFVEQTNAGHLGRSSNGLLQVS